MNKHFILNESTNTDRYINSRYW